MVSFFIAGLGQIIKGDGEKGIKIMLWFYLGLPFLAVLSMILNPYLFLFVLAIIIIVYPVLWAYNIIDAFAS